MSRSDEQRLDDIREMCSVAADIVGRGRAALDSDQVLWLALERAVEVAGEAATQLTETARRDHPGVAWRELLGVRVVLAHAYHRVDRDLLWGIASKDLSEIARALGPLAEPDENGPR